MLCKNNITERTHISERRKSPFAKQVSPGLPKSPDPRTPERLATPLGMQREKLNLMQTFEEKQSCEGGRCVKQHDEERLGCQNECKNNIQWGHHVAHQDNAGRKEFFLQGIIIHRPSAFHFYFNFKRPPPKLCDALRKDEPQ